MRTETDNTWSAITLLVCLLLAALCLLIVDGGTPTDLGKPTPTLPTAVRIGTGGE